MNLWFFVEAVRCLIFEIKILSYDSGENYVLLYIANRL